jgi:hypothetical protein
VCVYCVYCTVYFATSVEGAGGVGAGGEGVPVDGDEQGVSNRSLTVYTLEYIWDNYGLTTHMVLYHYLVGV